MIETKAPQFFRWDDVPLEKVSDTLSRKLVTGEHEMVTQIFLKKGCVVPTHSHVSEQVTMCITGSMKFDIAGQEYILKPGELILIPSWVEHSAYAFEDTLEMDIFSPIRQDWLDKTDSYLRGADSAAPPSTQQS